MKKLLARGLKPKILALPANLFSVTRLYWLCAIMFAMQIIQITLKVFVPSERLNSPAFSLILYLIFLVLYALRQVIDIIKGKVGKKMKGWIFVLIWCVFVLGLCLLSQGTHGRYKVPAAAYENLTVVILVFSGRNIARILWLRKTKRTKGIRAYIIFIFFGRKVMQAYCRQRAIQNRIENTSRRTPHLGKGIPNAVFRI
ncbi:MAG: hypothetical protein WC528_00015 [Patescibacteria group bacterium]